MPRTSSVDGHANILNWRGQNMELASELGIGIGALAVGVAMIWFGMPNKAGESVRFLRPSFMLMIYPAAILLFLVIGVAELFKALY
jgi:hypothetical protein